MWIKRKTARQSKRMQADDPLEWLEHERRKAWSEGYAAGWKDHECDFPPYTSENPYKETNKIGKDGE